MKKSLRFLLTSLKWLVLAVVAVEVFCFLIVTASNYLIYGHYWEGSRVRYDPYALFLNDDGPRPTAHNPAHPGPANPHHLDVRRLHHAERQRPASTPPSPAIWPPSSTARGAPIPAPW